MPPAKLVLFDDDAPGLAPLTDLRPACEIRFGAMTTIQRVSLLAGAPVDGVIVPERLRGLAVERYGELVRTADDLDEGTLLVNARYVGSAPDALQVGDREELVDRDGQIVAARGAPKQTLLGDAGGMACRTIGEDVLACRPWDAVRLGQPNIATDAALLATRNDDVPPGVLRRGEHHLTLGDSVDLWPGVVLDLTTGPIVLGDHTTVRPNAVIAGPTVLGPHNTVADGAQLRSVATGPHVKLGGEVKGVIVQGYANKAHNGYLGDSWVGEWVNLGAETVGSNLLNTYSEITSTAAPGTSRERTGMQFFGAVLGDHVKTAIGTRLMTGSIAHTGVMWAATEALSGCAAAFTWATDAGRKPYRIDRFVEVARAMMGRRGIEPTEAYLEALKHAATSERACR